MVQVGTAKPWIWGSREGATKRLRCSCTWSTMGSTDSIIKHNIILFERPKILQECSNQATRKENVFLATRMKPTPVWATGDSEGGTSVDFT